MIPFFLFSVYTLAAVVLEGFVSHLPLIHIRIDFLWILVLYTSFFLPDFRGGSFVVIALALIQESLGSPVHGFILLPYLLTYCFIRMTRQQLVFDGGIAQMVWIALLSLAEKGFEIGLLHWQGYPAPLDPWRLVPWAVLQGSLAPLLFRLFKKINRLAAAER